jgi:hypothetical protein
VEIKKVMRYQKDIKRLRVFRFIFSNKRKCLTFSIEPKFFKYEKTDWPEGKILTFLGMRFHYKSSGGLHV